jgi:aspartate aminotransferase-like enzyme
VLSCVNGAFAERWFDVAVSNGKQATRLEAEWNQPIRGEMVAQALRQKRYEVITVVHNETSTGLAEPGAGNRGRQCGKPARIRLICVDAVSSLAGARLEMDAWGLDMVLTSSQKCLALPPGLGLAAVSDRALDTPKGCQTRGWYFDLLRLEKAPFEGLDPRYAGHVA